MTTDSTVRHRGYVDLRKCARPRGHGWTGTCARGKRFGVDWLCAGETAETISIEAEIEAVLILPDAPVEIAVAGGHAHVPGRSLVLCPAGPIDITAAAGASLAVIRPLTGNGRTLAVNDGDYGSGDEGIRPVGASSRRRLDGPQVIRADDITAPADKPRLKIVRGATLSVSWIEYEGTRDRANLSPHSHDDFEQGSLALSGDFVHHLRTPWGKNANVWRDDEHLTAASPSLCVIPPKVVHTTEGMGDQHHLLIDIFAPARSDFLAKGWVSNATDFDD